MFMSTPRPCMWASETMIFATEYGCMYTGWTATSGRSDVVLSMITCATSQGSSMLLSV